MHKIFTLYLNCICIKQFIYKKALYLKILAENISKHRMCMIISWGKRGVNNYRKEYYRNIKHYQLLAFNYIKVISKLQALHYALRK